MKRYTRIVHRGAVLSVAAATIVTVAAGVSSAGTRVTATPAVHTGLTSLMVKPHQINQFCDYTSAEPQIGYGSTGLAVKQAQCELDSVDNGPTDLPSDGIFGPETKAWTEWFQGCAGIKQDGIIGPITWRNLDAWSAVARPCD